MKSLKEIKEELIRDGAVQRLQDLNKERDILLKIINYKPSKQAEVIESAARIRRKTAKGFKYKPGTHWTQTPAGKRKLKKVLLAMKEGKNGRSHSQVH